MRDGSASQGRVVLGGLLLGAVVAAAIYPHALAALAQPNDAAEAQQPGGKKTMGWIISIKLPITSQTHDRVVRFATKALDQARKENVQPVLVFEFVVPPDQKEYARDSKFSAAWDLADFLSGARLRSAGDGQSEPTTVAFVPQSIQGHAVLAVLACEKIFMAPDAEIGPAAVEDGAVTPPIRSAYQDIAARRKVVPAAVALKLVDSSQELLEVTTDVDQRYVTAGELPELRKHRTVSSTKKLIEAGQPGRFSGREARAIGMASRLCADRREVAQQLGLPPEAMVEDPLLTGDAKAIRVDLKGRIKADTVDQLTRLIGDARGKDDVNFVCLWIDSAGGSATDSVRLANFLVGLDPAKVYTVAYIPAQARSDAALVAMACNQVVMRPHAVLGGEGDYIHSDGDAQRELPLIRDTLRKEIAPKRGRTWSPWMAMIDPNLEVFRCTREGDVGGVNHYMSGEELSEQADPGQWRKGEMVTRPGKPFSVDGNTAVEYRLAAHVVDSFHGFKELYGLEDDPALVEPGWADFLIDALARPEVAILLLVIGGAALYAELHAPGIGLGGFIATVCFAMFFWSRFLGGTAGWLEVILFVAGICCLLVEVFVLPGFGIFGLGGGALILASLILASQTFFIPRNSYQFAQLQRSLLMIGGSTVGIIVAALLLNRYLPKTPLLGQIVLEPPSGDEAETIKRREALVDYDNLLGVRGTTTTPLVPSGKAMIANRLVDVMTDGEFIARGVRVEVVEVHGNRILVREVD